MKKLFFSLPILFLTFTQCEQKPQSFQEQINGISLVDLEKLVLERRANEILLKNIKFDAPIPLNQAKGMVQRYVDDIVDCYNLPANKKDSIERSVLLPFGEIRDNFILLSQHSNYSDTSKFQYRIYFGKNQANPASKYFTGHSAVLRLCYDGQNLPDSIQLQGNPIVYIRTIFNVGNICPPNCPPSNGSGGIWEDDMYIGE